jgi:hypothetical protein
MRRGALSDLRGDPRPGRANIAPEYGTAHVAEGHEETYIHSSVVFLKKTRLRGGGPSTHRAGLRIEPVPPRHFAEAAELQRDANSSWTFKRRLVASVNIVRGRDPKRQKAVKMNLPMSPASRRAAPRPRVSTPKRPTGPSR